VTVVITVVLINCVNGRVTKLISMNSRPVYATFRRPITVMNKITERQKEQEIAAELGNSTNAFTN